MTEELVTYCPKCYCVTKSILKDKIGYVCGKCGKEKSVVEMIHNLEGD